MLASLPVRGEWIEIVILEFFGGVKTASLPVRGEWIEISILGL